jgi:hypothetical protein
MPRFIERLDDPQIPPPYDLPGVMIRSFELAADINKLGDLCNTLLNIGSLEQRGFEYQPLLGRVALEVLSYPHMRSLVPPFSGWGYVTQRELYFRFPVVRYDYVLGFLVPVEISNFFPFIFVNNAWSAFSGREVIGFPKVIGKIDSREEGSYTASLELPVFPAFRPTQPQECRSLVRIEAAIARDPLASKRYRWPWNILGEAESLGALGLELDELIDENLFSTIQLKQIRDAGVPTEACFQGLVHADFQVSNLSHQITLHPASLTLTPTATLDLAAQLGLPDSGRIEAEFAYGLQCDMTFRSVSNLFINA